MKNKIIITEETAAVLNFYGLTFSRGHSISPIYPWRSLFGITSRRFFGIYLPLWLEINNNACQILLALIIQKLARHCAMKRDHVAC